MVPHRRLIQKLEGYGNKDDLLKWIESFLGGRRQRVFLGDLVSEWVNVTSGDHQGSVLGPLMYQNVNETCECWYHQTSNGSST